MDSHLNLEKASNRAADSFNSIGMSRASASSHLEALWVRDRASSRAGSLNRRESVRFAALSLFCDPVPDRCSQLLELSVSDWRGLKRWLDFGGLSLYFLDRLLELKVSELLPTDIFTQLHLNLIDNTERTRRMLDESLAIQRGFQREGVAYAALKGISLWPVAVPRPELRLQFDLDYLVAEKDVAPASGVLEHLGYRMHALSGRTSEFKKNERPGVWLQDIYKHFDSYAVEIHAEAHSSARSSLLSRIEWREVNGIKMPVLDQADLFLGQALHVFKHLSGEYTRASLILELQRHVLARQDSHHFWDELRSRAMANRRAEMGLGIALYLTEFLMGRVVPEAARSWTVDNVPDRIRAWIQTYVHRVILQNPPGTKLYLLLQKELQPYGIEGRRSARKVLLPRRLPRMVIGPCPEEEISIRLRRYTMQFVIVLSRVQFHIFEGLRYVIEARRWRRSAGESR